MSNPKLTRPISKGLRACMDLGYACALAAPEKLSREQRNEINQAMNWLRSIEKLRDDYDAEKAEQAEKDNQP